MSKVFVPISRDNRNYLGKHYQFTEDNSNYYLYRDGKSIVLKNDAYDEDSGSRKPDEVEKIFMYPYDYGDITKVVKTVTGEDISKDEIKELLSSDDVEDDTSYMSITIPVDSAKSAVMVFKKIGIDKYIEVTSGYVKSVSDRPVINRKIQKSELSGLDMTFGKVALQDKIVTSSISGTAFYIKHSPICGNIAVEAEFKHGLNNAIYSVFSSVGSGKSVNKDGVEITSSRRYSISSVLSDKSAKKSGVRADVFSSIERKYVVKLHELYSKAVISNDMVKSSLVSMQSSLNGFKSRLASDKAKLNEVLAKCNSVKSSSMKKNSDALYSLVSSYKRDLDSKDATIDSLKEQLEGVRRLRMESDYSKESKEISSRDSRVAKNAEFLASLM